MAQKSSLLAKVAQLPSATARPSFFDTVASHQQKELLDLKQAYAAGELKDSSGSAPALSALHRLVVKELGITVCATSFNKWIRQ